MFAAAIGSVTSKSGGSNFRKTAHPFVEGGFPFLLLDLAGIARRDSSTDQLGLFAGADRRHNR